MTPAQFEVVYEKCARRAARAVRARFHRSGSDIADEALARTALYFLDPKRLVKLKQITDSYFIQKTCAIAKDILRSRVSLAGVGARRGERFIDLVALEAADARRRTGRTPVRPGSDSDGHEIDVRITQTEHQVERAKVFDADGQLIGTLVVERGRRRFITVRGKSRPPLPSNRVKRRLVAVRTRTTPTRRPARASMRLVRTA